MTSIFAISVGSLINAGLPNITGNIDIATSIGRPSGALNFTGSDWANPNTWVPGGNNFLNLDASRSSSIYGSSSTVTPNSLKVGFYISY